MKKFILIILLSYPFIAYSQVVTTVTATLTDSNGQVWSNASVSTQIVAPFGNPNKLNNQGQDPVPPVSIFADNTGTFTIQLDDNTVVLPKGSTTKFTICPNATVPVCSTSIQVIHGVSMNLSSSLSADLVIPTVSASPSVYRAYVDSEASGGQGAIYWRTTDNSLRGFNGSVWVPIGSGGAGSTPLWSNLLSPTNNLTLSMNNFTTLLNMGTTGSTGAAFDITDSSTNTGSNYLLRVWTGSGSTAKTVAFCDNNTFDCVEFNNSGVFRAIGDAQNIATGVLNTGAGVGVIQLGSNGSGSISQANTIKLTGNSNKAFISENAGTLSKVLLGGQLTCSAGTTVQSTDVAGNVTCFNILSGSNTYTGANTFSVTQQFSGIRLGIIQQIFGSNTDLAGSLAFTGGTTSASYTFSGTYAHPPICTYAPTFNPTTTAIWISTMNNTTLQFSSSTNLTGSVDYMCVTTAVF